MATEPAESPWERGVDMRKFVVLALALVVAAIGVTACGGDDDDDSAADTAATTTTQAGGGGGGGTLKVTADPGGDLVYEEKSLSTNAGPVTIEFDNPSSTDHDVTIEDDGGTEVAATDIITDDTATATADLQAGSYTFFCSVDGHREAGMEGPLTVK
jgi:plastocyanin